MDDIKLVDASVSKGMEDFAAAIDAQGFVYSWGHNQFGQLGLGDFRN